MIPPRSSRLLFSPIHLGLVVILLFGLLGTVSTSLTHHRVQQRATKGALMKARILSRFLLVLALILVVGSGPVQGAQTVAHPAPASANAGPAATAPWFIETVDPALGVGSYVSVAIDPDNDTTYISYYDNANKDLKMATYVGSGGNCSADSNWSCETVDSSGDVGKYSSIAIDPTTHLPAIAYWRTSPPNLKLATAWSGGWDIITVDEFSGSYASLKIDATGAAHVVYHRPIEGLMYAKRVGGGSGNCGGNNYRCDVIHQGNGIGHYASLALDATGQPRIAYHEGGGGLWYAQPGGSGNCGPGNDWDCNSISASPGAGTYASLDVDNSNTPHVAYYDAGKLMYAVLKGSNGNCGSLNAWRCDEIDAMGTDSHTRDVSLAVDNAGLPVIAYHKYIIGDPFSAVTFNLARPAAALGLQSGNCGPQNLWRCERIRDSGHSGDYSAIAVHPSGLATIAYLDSEYFGALRVAYQRFQVFLPLVVKNH